MTPAGTPSWLTAARSTVQHKLSMASVPIIQRVLLPGQKFLSWTQLKLHGIAGKYLRGIRPSAPAKKIRQENTPDKQNRQAVIEDL